MNVKRTPRQTISTLTSTQLQKKTNRPTNTKLNDTNQNTIKPRKNIRDMQLYDLMKTADDSGQPSYMVFDWNASFFTLASSESYLLKYSATFMWFKSSSASVINATVVEQSVDWDRWNFSACLWGDIGTLEKPEENWGSCSLLIIGPEKLRCSELPQGTGITRWSCRNRLSFVQSLFALLIRSIWNITQHTA